MSEIKMEEVSLELVVDFGEAEGVQAGYKEGYKEGYKDGEADGHADGYQEGYARGEDEGYAKGYESGYTEGETDGHTAGKQAEYDAFWDAYQQNGTRYGYYYAFAGSGWDDETFCPKYDIVLKGSNIYAFAYCTVTDLVNTLEKCGVILDTSLSTTNNYMFYNSQTKRLPPINLTGHRSVSGVFVECWNLESIEKIIVVENNTFSDVFTNCPNLKNITFEGVIGKNGLNLQWSTKLSKASWRSIVSCLSATTTGLSITGSLASVKKAFETAAGANDGNTSDEWLALIATKPNWTITLA